MSGLLLLYEVFVPPMGSDKWNSAVYSVLLSLNNEDRMNRCTIRHTESKNLDVYER